MHKRDASEEMTIMTTRQCFTSIVASTVILFTTGILVNSSDAKIDPGTTIGIWLFDEGKGEIAKDISKNGNHAKLVGAKWTQGKHGKAVEFDGTNHVKIAASKSTDDYLNGFTYCLWIKPLSAAGNDHVRIIERNWHNPGIYIGPKNFFGSIVSGGALQPAVGQSRGGKPEVGKWTFIALTHDKNLLLLYVDNELVAKTKIGKPDLKNEHDGGSIWLASWKAPGWSFAGVIDEVGIFNTELSADTLKDISAQGFEKHMSAVSTDNRLTTKWGLLKTL